MILVSKLCMLLVQQGFKSGGYVVRGDHIQQYPPQLQGLWDKYDNKNQLEKDRPGNLPGGSIT